MLTWLWLLLYCTPISPGTASVFPPPNAIVVTDEKTVTLAWNWPATKFRAQLLSGQTVICSEIVEGNRWAVPVQVGEVYSWRLTPMGQSQPPMEAQFRVSNQFEHRCDGRSASRGRDGTNGGQIRARLARNEAGINLWIAEGERSFHYVFAPNPPPRPFLISVRGGDGGPGQDGMEFDQEVKARGGKGGRAGWGGTVEISTKDMPWRKYLVIDVSPGTPGQGGKGGRYYRQGVLHSGPEGSAGQEGQAGQVMTSVEP